MASPGLSRGMKEHTRQAIQLCCDTGKGESEIERQTSVHGGFAWMTLLFSH